MPRTVMSSWRHGEDGKLEHSDYKVCIHDEDSTYEIETSRTDMGIDLGSSRDGNNTIITRIFENDRTIEKIKSFISVGDILVAINDRVVLEEPFADVMSIIDLLTMGGFPRRFKFLNVRKCSLEAYLRKVELTTKLKTDMLGFNSTVEEILNEQAFRQQTHAVTVQRDLEWVDYLKSIGGPENLKPAGIFKPSMDLKAMVRRGIPVAFRALVWPRISLSSLHRLNYPKDYYQQLLQRVENGELNGRVKDDIEKDVDRTFPEHVYFENAGRGEAVLRRVLQAFAIHNPDIGYCQSLNFVAGMILILLEEEEAFWLLVTIVEKLLPPDYYTKSMVGTYVDQFVLAHIIKKYLPKIHATLEKNQLQLPLITVQWFMCLFVNTLRPEVALRVWDVFLNEGNKVLFRISAALFKLHEKRLLAVKDASDLFTVLRSIGKDVMDADVLMATAYKDFTKMASQRLLVRSRSVPSSPSTTPQKKMAATSATSVNTAASSAAATAAPSSTSAAQHGSPPGSPHGHSHHTQRRRSSLAAKIHTSFSTLISPRLQSKSYLGAVPRDLIGVGFAHTGPADAVERHRLLSASFAATSAATLTAEEAAAVAASASAVAAALAADDADDAAADSATDGSHPHSGVGEHSNGTTNVSGTDGAPTMKTEDSASIDPTTATNTTATAAPYTPEELMTNPALLLDRVSEIHRPGSFSEYKRQLDAKKRSKVKKSDQRDRRVKNGELSFYRADIALWRSSFRPGLEERYCMMEAARSKWRSENAVAVAAAATSSSVETAAATAEDGEGEGEKVTSTGETPPPVRVEAVAIDRVPSIATSTTSSNASVAPVTPTLHRRPSASTPVITTRGSRHGSGIFSAAAAAAVAATTGVDLSSNSSAAYDEDDANAIVLETTYSIDHTFDTDPLPRPEAPTTPTANALLRPRLSFSN